MDDCSLPKTLGGAVMIVAPFEDLLTYGRQVGDKCYQTLAN